MKAEGSFIVSGGLLMLEQQHKQPDEHKYHWDLAVVTIQMIYMSATYRLLRRMYPKFNISLHYI